MKLLEILTKGTQEQIQGFISSCFVKNMEFFRQSSIGLFEELKKPPTSYNLVFDTAGINIINLKTKQKIYPIFNQQSVMIETHLEISTSPLKNHRWKIHSNEVFLSSIDTEKLPITGFVVNEMIEILKKHKGVKEYHLHPKFMPTSVLYGLFGGLFLQFLIDEGVFFHSLLIFEEDIDLFRISCYFLDFEKLFENVSNKSCYIFVKDVVNKKFIRNFFASRKITSNFLLCELQMYSSKKVQEIQSCIMQEYSANKRGWGSFEDEIIGFVNTLCNKEIPILLQKKKIEAPICVVGNGASLDDLLPFIKKNQEKMLIFSCGTALKPLKNFGIKVDFQIEIERIDYLADVLRDAPLGDTPLLCGNMVNPKALSLAKEKFLFLRGGSSASYLFEEIKPLDFSAPFVGNAGVALAMYLSDRILLCGIDCAYIKGKSKHAKKSFYGDEEVKIPENAIQVRGNKKQTVFSDSVFLLSLQNIVEAIRIFNPKEVLNLGSGAYIEGARSVEVEEIRLKKIYKEESIKVIKGLMQHSKMKSFDKNIQIADSYHQEIINILKEGARNKKELFILVDRIFGLIAKQGAQNPHLGILFEGSLGHMLQGLLLASLHIPSDDIFVFYAQCLEIIILGLDKMFLRYKLLLSLYQEATC
ncbi:MULTISPECIES: motility associated factor glycosyltransferase family protein [unclassified Helicobacter]|uniref:motility associated factor glycosyltransferase family protein n=1 Tax=unclassified Helicobacter TaxID=2593540 RepID=UPI000CF0831B|nr:MULTISPECIES: 6-hydroxymethylpterin diphosphokinase MptE-like protein [unclassified Helicobacter]